MKNYTSFLKGNKTLSRMAGLPKTIQVFDKRSSTADVIKIERFLAVLDRLWNFLATQERMEEDLAADREIDDFLYGDAL